MGCFSPYPSLVMSIRRTTADASTAPAGAMTARGMLMSMTSKIITDPSGPELARAT